MSDVDADVFAKWGVIPNYVVPLPVSSSGGRSRFVV